MSDRSQQSRAAAVAIVRTLREHGHVAYLAGGCVRDSLLGIAPKDHDVATDASPEVVQRFFKRSQAVGAAFGVILVYTGRGEDRIATEVATFRKDAEYTDGRRPDAVTFADAPTDALRRDFTVNGLFESPAEAQGAEGSGARGSGEATKAVNDSLLHTQPLSPLAPRPLLHTLPDGSLILDYVGGLADLACRTLRAIGDPDARFGEDYLRMLRAVRFTARLGFTLEDRTAKAIRNAARYLGQISRERIGGEVQAMLLGPNPAQAATLLQQLRLDGPTLNEEHGEPDLPTLGSLRRFAPDAGYAAHLACWLIDRHGLSAVSVSWNKAAQRWRSALSLSNDHHSTLQRILQQRAVAAEWDTFTVAQRKRLLGSTDFDQTLAVLRALGEAECVDTDIPGLRDDGIGIAPVPLVTGNDLIAQGLAPGPVFKRILDAVYDAQLEGRVRTPEQAQALIAAFESS
jgi:tRNA nucleotidyltransferase/poly(A) polymerase